MEAAADLEHPSQITCFEILPRLPSKSLMRFIQVLVLSHPQPFLCHCPSKLGLQQAHSPAPLCLGQIHKAATLLHLTNQPTRKPNTLHPHSKPSNALNQERTLYLAQSINGLVCLTFITVG
ncbi:unnamed protein product [Prunus brigantina]